MESNKQYSVLSKAAENDDLETARYLVIENTGTNCKNPTGIKPLHMAAMYGHENIVKLFLNLGVPVDSSDCSGCTPLHHAAENGQIQVVKLLIKKGANIEAKNSFDYTPILLAAENGHKDVVQLLIFLGASIHNYTLNKSTVLHYVVREEWFDILQSIAQRGADLNAKTSLGYPSLLVVAKAERRHAVDMLIRLGADIHCYEEDGTGVLHYASQHGWFEIVQSLVRKKVPIDATNSEGSPVLFAAKNGHKKIVEYLIVMGANIHIYDSQKFGVLHYAAREDWVDVVDSLVKKEVDLHATTIDGSTPLHIACGSHKFTLEVALYLLKVGADCNAKDMMGNTPLSYCPLIEERIARIFIENGAYFTSSDMKYLVKINIVQDIELCTQAIINKFNHNDLHMLYKLHQFDLSLPCIEKLKINAISGIPQMVEQAVQRAKQRNRHCNLLTVQPLVLKMMSLKSLIRHYFGKENIE